VRDNGGTTEERLQRIERLLLLVAKALLATPIGVGMPFDQVEELRDLLLERRERD
jgi:hypothetical protein